MFPPRASFSYLIMSSIINTSLNRDRHFFRKRPTSAQNSSLTRTVLHAHYEYPVSQRGRKQTASGLSGWLYQACRGQACQVGVRQVRQTVKQSNHHHHHHPPPPPLSPSRLPSLPLRTITTNRNRKWGREEVDLTRAIPLAGSEEEREGRKDRRGNEKR